MLLIGLTAIMFNAIQNSVDINKLSYFTKIVAQSVLYLGCAMMLMTGCTSLNRFIGENVSANSGRDMMMAFRGLGAGIAHLRRMDLKTIAKREHDAAVCCAQGLRELGFQAFTGENQGGTVSFIPKMDCEDAAQLLANAGIGVRAGLH